VEESEGSSTRVKGAAQLPQNFVSRGFSNRHFGQSKTTFPFFRSEDTA
jgi:hypothetical protein